MHRASPHEPDEPGVPEALAASWRQAEGQLFPALVMDPDLYRRVVTQVSATLGHLRSRGASNGALLAAANRGPALVRDALAEQEANPTGPREPAFDPDLLARAALAMRHREVVAEQAAARRRALVAAARAAGQTWAVVEESGEAAGDPFLPYLRLEVAVRTGRALLVSATADEEYRTVEHAVRVVRVDLDTGGVIGSDDGEPGTTAVLADAGAREDRVATLRRTLEG